MPSSGYGEGKGGEGRGREGGGMEGGTHLLIALVIRP